MLYAGGGGGSSNKAGGAVCRGHGTVKRCGTRQGMTALAARDTETGEVLVTKRRSTESSSTRHGGAGMQWT
eukprot:3586166-Rhodomonas_salina.1